MGYVFLSLALFAGVTKGYCGKRMGNHAKGMSAAVRMNLIRMLFCIPFGVLLMLVMGDIASFSLEPRLILLAALSGVGTSAFVVLWLVSVRKSAYMMLDVFLTLGAIVPMLLGWACFGEGVSLRQWIGFAVLLGAAALMCSYNNAIKQKLTPLGLLLLVLCGLANGITDFTQKWFVKTMPEVPATLFSLYTYVFAALTLLIVSLCFSFAERKSREARETLPRRIVPVILIMSLALILNSYFKTLAAGYLSGAQLYPLNQGAALVLSTLMAALFFGEKPNAKCIVGIVLAFAGLLVMNL